EFEQAEGVQAMVVWADRAHKPLAVSQHSTSGAGAAFCPSPVMPPIERPPLTSEPLTSYVSILSTHQDCVAPGVAVREVRPPLTETSPLPPNVPIFDPPSTSEEKPQGEPLRSILLTRQPVKEFGPRSIPRAHFMLINRLAFRGGTFFPLHPDGPHAALVRPFLLIHDVVGMDRGVWYYLP